LDDLERAPSRAADNLLCEATMNERLKKQIEDIPALDQVDAAALTDVIVDAAIDVLMSDQTLPKRTAFEWWLALATLHARVVEKITSQIYDHIDRQDATNVVEWED
jgi:hypothetical protein